MKNEDFIRELAEKAFSGSRGKTNQKAIEKALPALREEATEKFGTQTFVKALLDYDNGGVLVTIKQPVNGLRLSHFVSCDVVKPPRKKDEPDDETQDDVNEDSDDDDQDDTGSTDDETQDDDDTSKDEGNAGEDDAS